MLEGSRLPASIVEMKVIIAKPGLDGHDQGVVVEVAVPDVGEVGALGAVGRANGGVGGLRHVSRGSAGADKGMG